MFGKLVSTVEDICPRCHAVGLNQKLYESAALSLNHTTIDINSSKCYVIPYGWDVCTKTLNY